jgi:hypothetical protein
VQSIRLQSAKLSKRTTLLARKLVSLESQSQLNKHTKAPALGAFVMGKSIVRQREGTWYTLYVSRYYYNYFPFEVEG